MPTREPPVAATEFVLRRVHSQLHDPSLPLSVSPEAFKPSSEDANGISLVRQGYTSKPEEVLALTGVKPEKLHLYHVARIPVTAFLEQGLSVVEDSQPGNPGHALVPELSTSDYNDKKKKQGLKDKMLELARIASSNIVYSPPQPSQAQFLLN